MLIFGKLVGNRQPMIALAPEQSRDRWQALEQPMNQNEA